MEPPLWSRAGKVHRDDLNSGGLDAIFMILLNSSYDLTSLSCGYSVDIKLTIKTYSFSYFTSHNGSGAVTFY